LADDGQLIASIEGLKFQLVTRQSLLAFTRKSWQDWLYEVEWQSQARFGLSPDYILTPIEINAALKPYVASSMAQLEFYLKLSPQLESLSVKYILNAFEKLGWTWKLNQHFEVTTIAEQLGIKSQHHQLLGRFLEILTEEGLLKAIGNSWEVMLVPEFQKPMAQMKMLLRQYSTANAELNLLARCGAKLAEVLQGEYDPLQLLFPEGDLTLTTQFYQNSPSTQVMNTLVQKVILSAIDRLPQERGIRILEIGAGTGGTTAYLLPHLQPHQTDYVFTDISSLFLTKAADKFNKYPYIRYQILNIEQSPQAQGFGEYEYDIIVAANVLHATKNLNQTLQHIQSLLMPGGILVLFELTARQRWIDLTFGLLEGWWRFTDHNLRPDYPLLSPEQWQTVLQKNGFPSFQALTLHQQAVMIAQKTADSLSLKTGENWLIFADCLGMGRQLASHLRENGGICTLVFQGQKYEQINGQTFKINPIHPEDFQQLFANMNTNGLCGIVHCWSLDSIEADLDTANQQGCGSTLHLVQTIVKQIFSQSPSLWLVTQGAMPVKTQNLPNPAQSPLWGMGKVIVLEHPELNCVRVDLDAETKMEIGAQALFEEINSETSEDQVAFRDNARYVARLVHHHQPESQVQNKLDIPDASSYMQQAKHIGKIAITPPNNATETNKSVFFHADSTYLITGGLGGLGLLVANWMVKQGAKHLVLAGRSDASPRVKNHQLKALEQAGAEVVVAKADVSVAEQITQLLTDIEQSLPPLRGIIHAAGFLNDGVLASKKWEDFAKIMAPKVQGAWYLHTLTQDKPLDFFVLFSSIASILGSTAQANHAAANAFLDALAHHRRAQGLPCMSINWGVWSKIGAAAERKTDERMHKKGLENIAPKQGLQILEQLFSQPATQVGVIPIKEMQFVTHYGDYPFFFDLKQYPQTTIDGESHEQDDGVVSTTAIPAGLPAELSLKINKASPEEKHTILLNFVHETAQQVLGFAPSQTLKTNKSLMEQGLDSLQAVEMRNYLSKGLKTTLSASLLLNYPSISKLVEYLEQEILKLEEPVETVQKEDEYDHLNDLSDGELEYLINQKLTSKFLE
jgi:NAD(P)-dependent dehydrogenase (short-subunit alcohol dehydrogenase family)/SAM-dependent methyltransferase/acyl carrier protein